MENEGRSPNQGSAEKRGLSQYALAQKSQVSQSFLSALEAEKKTPTVPTLEKICRVLGVSLSGFFAKEAPTLPPHIEALVEEMRHFSPEQIWNLLRLLRSLRENTGH